MEKIYIYKYTNKLNGHAYIGKTNNIERRKREHLSNSQNPSSSFYYSLWCQKIRQYGYENFDFEILEVTDSEHWREREQYWIKYYNTFEGAGYNRDPGGDDKGERQKALTEAQAAEVRDLLLHSDETQAIIADTYHISETLLSNINQGLKYVDDTLAYPLRKNYKTFDDYSDLIHDIVYTTIPLTELQQKYGYGYSTIKKINEGKLWHQDNLSYPLRKADKHQAKAIQIKELLKNSSLSFEDIANQWGVSIDTIRRINRGATHHDDNESYPLRKPVSTIPKV